VLDAAAKPDDADGQVGLCSFGQVLAFQDEGRRQGLSIQGRITPRAETGSFKKKRVEKFFGEFVWR